MSKVCNSWWYSTLNGNTIGIVKTIDENTNEIKFRIGLADGIDELADQERIKAYGARFYPEVIK